MDLVYNDWRQQTVESFAVGMRAVLLCVLLLGSSAALAALVDPTDPVVQWSFETCRQDSMCAARWQLSQSKTATANERQKFDEMMVVFLERREDGGVGALGMMQACAGQTTEECNALQYMWLGMLREAHVCDVNEEWIPEHGCHCMDGKHCAVDCTDAALSDLWSFTVAVGIIGLGVVSLFVWEVRKEEDLSNAVERKMALGSNNYYLAQARLYAAENAPMLQASPVAVIATSSGVQI